MLQSKNKILSLEDQIEKVNKQLEALKQEQEDLKLPSCSCNAERVEEMRDLLIAEFGHLKAWRFVFQDSYDTSIGGLVTYVEAVEAEIAENSSDLGIIVFDIGFILRHA